MNRSRVVVSTLDGTDALGVGVDVSGLIDSITPTDGPISIWIGVGVDVSGLVAIIPPVDGAIST